MTRTLLDAKSGLPINAVTGWLDGSQVYGSRPPSPLRCAAAAAT